MDAQEARIGRVAGAYGANRGLMREVEAIAYTIPTNGRRRSMNGGRDRSIGEDTGSSRS